MIYIYDILLNWTDNSKIYEFFEWNPNDSIEHIKKMPLVKVSSTALKDLKENLIAIDINFLDKIKNKSEIFCAKKKEEIEFACLFTDEKQVLAVEFDEEGKNLYRSYLLLDEELEILEIGERLDEQTIFYQVISPYEKYQYLTRNEEIMRRYLLKELKNTYQSKNWNKLEYLYSEYFGKSNVDPKQMYQSLIDSLAIELNDRHHQIYKLLKLSHTKKQV